MDISKGKLWFLLVFTTIIFFFFSSCKKEKVEDKNDVIIPETTKVISAQQWQEGFISLDSTNWEFSLNPALVNEFGIKPGDVFVSAAGTGMLRRVTSVTNKGGVTVLGTTQAAITEAIQRGKISFSKDLSQQLKQAKITYLAEGVKLDTASRDGKETQLAFSLEIPIHEHITITGDLSIDPIISGEVEIDDFNLEYFIMEFQIIEEFGLTATADIASLNLEKEVEVVSITFPTFTVLVGTVPVLVTPQFTLALGVNMKLSSELTVGISQELTATAGIEYTNGNWSPILDLEKDFGHEGPSLNNTLEAKAYIKPQLNMMFYGCISPYLATELYGKVEAELGATPWWELFAGLSAEIGVELSVWSITLVDVSEPLFDLKIPLATSTSTGDTPPEASFTVSPSSGTIYTNFLVDASGCTDLKDPASELQVRWDWNNDGVWDTDYSTTKQNTHKYTENGNYMIALQVKDSDGLTDIAKKPVSVYTGVNHNPTAAFTIDPSAGQDTTIYHFDASGCSDQEDPLNLLEVQWDWDYDGFWDTPLSTEKTATNQFALGYHRIALRVIDTEGLEDTCSVQLFVYEGNPTNSFTDPRDGKVYGTVLIGSQWWMSENLNYGTMIDSELEQTDNNIPEKYCLDNDESKCDIYGGLYEWDELMKYTTEPGTTGICPSGWHVPTEDEFLTLINYLGGKQVAGGKMKQTGFLYWQTPNTGATNESGFTALGAGFRLPDGRTIHETAWSYIFTSDQTPFDDESVACLLRWNEENTSANNWIKKKYGASLRCIKDE